jgi:eukaryotic-like serine/threonine-protein kinase
MTESDQTVPSQVAGFSGGLQPEPGQLIDGTYRVTAPIGGGAMGVVYLADDVRLGRAVALKLIREQLLGPGFRALFRQEARAMALVNHPNVVTIYSFGEHVDVPYFAMEFVQGKSLDRLVDESGGVLELDLAFGLLDQACLGLSAIHEAGAVHRDIKPSNLLIDAHGRLRIGDLGLAASYREGTGLREVVGTPGYIPPEIVLEQGDATPRSDLYSLACVAYELLVGRPLYVGSSGDELNELHVNSSAVPPSEARPGLPRALDAVIGAALAKDPAARTPTVEIFRCALSEVRAGMTDPTRILVVEDDPDQRLMLQLTLEDEFPNAEVECVADGEAALAAFQRRPASVVISDLQMPGKDGLALTAALRNRSEADAVPIILLTASGGPAQWRVLSALGADGFVIKPANVEDVISSIRRALRERRARVAAKPGNGHARAQR